jgi:hypothetical protein
MQKRVIDERIYCVLKSISKKARLNLKAAINRKRIAKMLRG